jgi:SAM-dependent methyltransferase
MNLYDFLYDPNVIDYGDTRLLKDGVHETVRERELLTEISRVLADLNIASDAHVLEVGASLGYNHVCHPHYTGVEYSSIAVELSKQRYGHSVSLFQADATNLRFEDAHFDFIFSFATLEHIPNIKDALSEINRVLKSGGMTYLSPAWNCRKWIVEKIDVIPYGGLSFRKRMEKYFIPLRESLLYRFIKAFPVRLLDEILLEISGKYNLRYESLHPSFDLIKQYGHVSDDDAFVNIDSHSAMTFFRSHGCKILSHPTLIKRLLCRGEAILVLKP